MIWKNILVMKKVHLTKAAIEKLILVYNFQTTELLGALNFHFLFAASQIEN